MTTTSWPARPGSSVAEGGASAVGGPEVGVGVGGFRLPPHPKPPAHNTQASRPRWPPQGSDHDDEDQVPWTPPSKLSAAPGPSVKSLRQK